MTGNIKFPPLPLFVEGASEHLKNDFRNYARAAILADRASQAPALEVSASTPASEVPAGQDALLLRFLLEHCMVEDENGALAIRWSSSREPGKHPMPERLEWIRGDLEGEAKRAGLAATAASPATEGEAKCSPTLTECPRCKNQISKCDGVFAAPIEAGAQKAVAPTWGYAKTVGNAIAQLQTMDASLPFCAALHLQDGRCIARGVTFSRERVVNDRWIDSKRDDVPYSIVVWSQPVESLYAAPTSSASTEAVALADAVREVLECPYEINEATVPSTGLDTPGLNLYQVVGTMHVALPRYRALKSAFRALAKKNGWRLGEAE